MMLMKTKYYLRLHKDRFRLKEENKIGYINSY